jgi:threonine aldolase
VERVLIDLRSDTVTAPTPPMRDAMASAAVGDDVYGEDPAVNQLQELSAAMLGTEAGLFVTSGTQGNLCGILSHCERGDEYIVGQWGHTYRYEGGGAAVLGSVQPQPLSFEPDGTLDLERVESLIKPPDPHYARTRLLCLENTRGGLALPLEYLEEAAALARRRGLGLHLDGARVFNAAVKHGVPVTEITRHFDTVSFCLSKGLGAPVGSVLCGSHEMIKKAHRWRKMLGGGMRQAGILAAAGIYALENNVDRLAEDHTNAATLADRLGEIDGLTVGYEPAQTNMVFITPQHRSPSDLADSLAARGILISPAPTTRLVTHLDVSAEDVEVAAAAIQEFFQSSREPRAKQPTAGSRQPVAESWEPRAESREADSR